MVFTWDVIAKMRHRGAPEDVERQTDQPTARRVLDETEFVSEDDD